MNNCAKYQDMISSFIDGELSSAGERELLSHVAECTSCRAMLDAYQSMFGYLTEDSVEPPAGLSEKIMSAVRKSGVKYSALTKAESMPKRKKPNNVWMRYAFAAACLAIILFTIPNIRMGSMKDAKSAPEATEEKSIVEESVDTKAAKAPAKKSMDAVEEEPGEASGKTSESACNDIPEVGANEFPESEGLGNICTITIFEELPDILADREMTDNGDGSFTIRVSPETAAALIEAGYDAYYLDEAAEVTDYTVVFVPAP